MRFLKVLLLPHLALLWSGQVLSAIGDFFYQIAMLWIAIKMAGSQGGIIIAGVEAGAALLFGLLGGIYADRWNRRAIMITVDLARALAISSLPLLATFGQLQFWQLIIVSLLVGSLGALFNPALQSSLPALVPNTDLLQATNGLMDVTRRLARTLGPSLAALLVTFLPLTHFFTLDAISFLLSAGAVTLMGSRFAWKPRCKTIEHTGIRDLLVDLRQGFQAARAHKPIALAIFSSGFISAAWVAGFVLGIPLLADRVLQGNVSAYGLIVGAYGVGNVVSNFVIGSMSLRRPVGTMFLGGLVVGSGFLLMVSVPSLPVAMLGASLAALGGPMGDIPMAVMMQTELPPHHLGKIYSLADMTNALGSLLGPLLALPLYQYLSVQQAISVCALIFVTTGLLGLLRFRFQEPPAHPYKQEPLS
ncbi:MFS transporter [Ktedonospora formicarum]|uniref:MFS transporter n=1 Tax=Ktedonospora formicarum TaxID=2778364 RepID=A0A8J3MR03_9CHLR|nr:MFS transporter [Ktedonospora formicarum]GHO45417.1 MFS transporter [Ktedonospora formicarum]